MLAASVARDRSPPKRASSAAIRYSGSASTNLATLTQASALSVSSPFGMMRAGAGVVLMP